MMQVSPEILGLVMGACLGLGFLIGCLVGMRKASKSMMDYMDKLGMPKVGGS